MGLRSAKGPSRTQWPSPTLVRPEEVWEDGEEGEPSDPKPVVGEKMEEEERERWSRDQSQ